MECKVFLFQFFKRDLSVLMEPKWNVKRERIQETVPSSGVLMEPKWNVKNDYLKPCVEVIEY